MNWMYAFWGAAGWATGVLSLMQMQVWKVRHERRNPLWINPNFIPVEERLKDQDWSVQELEPFIPTPREDVVPPPISVMQECPHCGRAFKRVATHIRMKHSTPSELPVEPELGVDDD